MIGLPLFLSVFATGVGFIALWVVADVVKKLASETQEMIAETEANMARMFALSTELNHKLENKLNDLSHHVTKLNKSHKNEVARLNALIAENEKIQTISRKAKLIG